MRAYIIFDGRHALLKLLSKPQDQSQAYHSPVVYSIRTAHKRGKHASFLVTLGTSKQPETENPYDAISRTEV